MNGEDVSWTEQFDLALKHIKERKVCEIMSTNIVSASADEHLMVILDRMIKNKYRRLPILSNGRPIGVVYLADIYYNFFSQT